MNQSEVLAASIRIAASPAEVFPYLVEPALLVQWIGTWADLNPKPGGLFALDVGDTQVRGSFVTVEPPDRVVFTWGIPGSDVLPAASSTVEIQLTADGDETVVQLFHRGLPPDQMPNHRAGWTAFLGQLGQAVTAS